MYSRHLSTKMKEYFKSTIKDHRPTMDCKISSNAKCSFENFNVLHHCKSDSMTKIYKALLIKKHTPYFNRQLFLN